MRDEINNQDAGIDVEKAYHIEESWDDCLPYGAHEDKTVEVWLEEENAH